MRLSFADAGLAALDALEGVDAAGLFVFEDQRPLRGIAGWLDWRLCGALSRILRDGHFTGAYGDALLFPCGGRLPMGRVFCFGAGPRAALDGARFAELMRRGCEAMTRAGSRAFVAELPEVVGVEELDRARTFLAEGATRYRGERIVLLGEARALVRDFRDAGGQMKALEIDSAALGSPGAAVAAAPARATAPRVGAARRSR